MRTCKQSTPDDLCYNGKTVAGCTAGETDHTEERDAGLLRLCANQTPLALDQPGLMNMEQRRSTKQRGQETTIG